MTKEQDKVVREILERTVPGIVKPESEKPLSLRIQQWIGRSGIASAILYCLLVLTAATILILVFGGLNYFLNGKPII